jgi:undecaprenyl phosphate-alpha-L-ara4N flippase subunit ArnE
MSPLVRSMCLVFGASVIGSFGMAFLKMGAGKLTKSIWSFLNTKLIFGVALFLGSSVLYAAGIKGGQLSVLYPMVSLGYVWGLVWAKIFFNEPLTKQKFAGLGLILLGVFFVGLGSQDAGPQALSPAKSAGSGLTATASPAR